jgi:hypothetical protein
MTRPDISMTTAEFDGFLERCPQMVVGAIGDDGWPTGSLATTRVIDGLVSLGFDQDDPMLDVLGPDPRVCCVADEHASYYEIRGVIIHGTLVPGDVADDFTLEPGRTITFDFGRLQHGVSGGS